MYLILCHVWICRHSVCFGSPRYLMFRLFSIILFLDGPRDACSTANIFISTFIHLHPKAVTGCTWLYLLLVVTRLYLAVTWVYLTEPACMWLYIGVPGCTWLCLAVPGCTWLFIVLPGSTLLYRTVLVVHGCTWLYFAVPGCTRLWIVVLLYLALVVTDCTYLPGCTWLYQTLPGCIWLYLVWGKPIANI